MVTLLLMVCVCFTVVTSCHKGSESQLQETVDSFSEAYFNWQFPRAVAYCTPESRRWLSYAASQVNEDDVDSLRAMDRGAEHAIDKVDYQNDSVAVARVTVRHFMAMDSLGHAGQLIDETHFALPVVYREEQWRVHLSSLPRAQREQ